MTKTREELVTEISNYLQARGKTEAKAANLILAKAHLFKLKPPPLNSNFDKELFIKAKQKALSCPYYFEAMKWICGEWFNAGNIPVEIQNWIKEEYSINSKVPTRRGRIKDYDMRLMLALEVWKLTQSGYSAGKNDATNSEDNAFSIVQEAALKAGYRTTELSIRDYYYQTKKYLG